MYDEFSASLANCADFLSPAITICMAHLTADLFNYDHYAGCANVCHTRAGPPQTHRIETGSWILRPLANIAARSSLIRRQHMPLHGERE
jgi:hypothetical protein